MLVDCAPKGIVNDPPSKKSESTSSGILTPTNSDDGSFEFINIPSSGSSGPKSTKAANTPKKSTKAPVKPPGSSPFSSDIKEIHKNLAQGKHIGSSSKSPTSPQFEQKGVETAATSLKSQRKSSDADLAYGDFDDESSRRTSTDLAFGDYYNGNDDILRKSLKKLNDNITSYVKKRFTNEPSTPESPKKSSKEEPKKH